MRGLVVCTLAWLILWPAVSRCQEADSGQVSETTSHSEATTCACHPECRCDETRAAHTDAFHLYQAAENLRGAGLNAEAELALAKMHVLLRELLIDAVAERVQAEVERLRRTKGPQEKIVIRISSTTAQDNELDLGFNDDDTGMAFICKPSHAVVHIRRQIEGSHRLVHQVEKLMSWPDEDEEEEEEAVVEAPTPGGVAQQQILFRVQLLELSRNRLREAGLDLAPAEQRDVFALRTDRVEAVAELVWVLRQTGIVRVLAEPVLATVDGRPFTYTVGGEVGTRIDGMPKLLDDGTLRLEIRVCQSELDPTANGAGAGARDRRVRMRMVDTGCDIEPGKSAIIRGLLQQRVVAAADESQPAQRDEVELLLLITPELVTARPPRPIPTARVPGTEAK